MTDRPAPNWQPITALPLVAQMIDGAPESARIQLENLEEARPRPHVLDDALVSRIVRSDSDQAEFLPVSQGSQPHPCEKPVVREADEGRFHPFFAKIPPFSRSDQLPTAPDVRRATSPQHGQSPPPEDAPRDWKSP
jgi:hypothetical protein